jgi:hypothetical protein
MKFKIIVLLLIAFCPACGEHARVSSRPVSLKQTEPLPNGLPPMSQPRDTTPALSDPMVMEDFSTYTSTANLISDPRGIYLLGEDNGTSQITLDTDVGYGTSSQSMRYTYVYTGANAADAQTVCRIIGLPRDVPEIWAEVAVRWSTNFSVDSGDGSYAHKLLFGVVRDLNYRWALDFPGGGGGTSATLEVPGTANDDYHTNVNVRDYWDGKWHLLRVHWRSPSNDTSPDGLYEWWIDGLKQPEGRTYGGNDTSHFISANRDGSGKRITTYGMALGRNKDDGAPNTTMHLWWGRIRIWESNPGW